MVHTILVLQLTVLVIFSGFGSIHSELIDAGGTEESSCGTILSTVQMSQKQLHKLDDTVRNITPNLKDNVELGFFKLFEKIQHFVESKFDELDRKMDNKFHETKTYIDSKLTMIEEKISEYTSHVDSKINRLESAYALNVNDTLNNNNACCQASLETAAFVRKITTNINDMNMRTLNISARLHEMNETIQNLTNLVVPTVVNNISRLDGLLNSTTELVHNVSDIITTTEVNKPGPSKCDRSQQEECCTVAVVGHHDFTQFTEMSARGHHTVVNMTSAGLQEYTMYFAVKGEWVQLLLSSTAPETDLYYQIGFTDDSNYNIYMNEQLPTVSGRVRDLYTTNIISREKYSYYYVTISGDILKVGRRGEPPLMTHTSTELRTLKYFSFKRWWKTAGEALYDCTAE